MKIKIKCTDTEKHFTYYVEFDRSTLAEQRLAAEHYINLCAADPTRKNTIYEIGTYATNN